MAMVVSKKALHEFLLVKCKEQTIEFTKKFKLRGNAPKMNKLQANLTRVIDEGGNSEEILDIVSQIRELLEEDVMSDLKTGRTSVFSKMRDENAKKGYN